MIKKRLKVVDSKENQVEEKMLQKLVNKIEKATTEIVVAFSYYKIFIRL